MTRVDEFNSFYASTFDQAVEVTYAVCGDRQVALEATVDAYRRAWRDWVKIRDRHPLGYVRTEAWKLTALSRSTHPLRRRHEEDSDEGLLDALAELTVDDRRLIVLMTLGSTDLEEASREVGLQAEEGIENVTTALARLEARLGQSIDQIERRMHGLAAVTDDLERPPSSTVRTAATRGRRRNTVLLVAAAVALIVGGGLVVAEGDALATRASLPYREKIGSERPDLILDSQKLGTDNLLGVSQVGRLDESATWSIDTTDKDVGNTTPYATCPTQRFADDNPLKVFVRTYSSDSPGDERVAQSIEVSRSPSIAGKAFTRLVSWYSNCEHPRVQLTDSYRVRRPFGDFTILRLQSHRSPERIFTVGFAHSGTVTSTLVHEVDGEKGPSIRDFATALNDSVSRVCADSGGQCIDEFEIVRADPPRTATAPAFLGIVDLPPVADIDKVWAGIEPTSAEVNPAATPCDKADFTGKKVEKAMARIFVVPGADLPQEFGIAETVGRFRSEDDAKDFVSSVSRAVSRCDDETITVKVDQKTDVEDDEFSGTSWRIGLEVSKGERAYYRMAIVRRGDLVAQVTFTPVDEYDISQKQLASVAKRAGQRLVHAE